MRALARKEEVKWKTFRSSTRPPFIDKSNGNAQFDEEIYLTFQCLLRVSACSLMLFSLKDSRSSTFYVNS